MRGLLIKNTFVAISLMFALPTAGLTHAQSPAQTPPDDDEGPAIWTENFIYVLEDGWNRTTEYQSLLQDVGIGGAQNDATRAARLVREFPYAFNGVWLMLTPEEARNAAIIARDRPGVVFAGVGFDVELCEQPCENGMIGEPYYGPQQTPTGFTRIESTDGDYTTSSVLIATMDTGVDRSHQDLNVIDGYDCTREGLLGEREEDAWARDLYGHGTHTNGTSAARDNDIGSRGIAAGMPSASVAILGDDGSGSMASLACGADVLAEWKITGKYDRIVANWSVGGWNNFSDCDSWDALHTAFCNLADLGIINVVSAGNDGWDAISKSPANYPEAVTVSALTDYDGLPGGLAAPPNGIPAQYKDDWRALFSDYGWVVDFIAPGIDIWSTLPQNTYGRSHGTSMAAPHVTGNLAAWWAMNPLATSDQVIEAALAWSGGQGWMIRSGWDAFNGPTNELLIRGGAPSLTNMLEQELVTPAEEEEE